jgi:hypothetical protein
MPLIGLLELNIDTCNSQYKQKKKNKKQSKSVLILSVINAIVCASNQPGDSKCSTQKQNQWKP